MKVNSTKLAELSNFLNNQKFSFFSQEDSGSDSRLRGLKPDVKFILKASDGEIKGTVTF
jgi:hypothetical protein